MGKSEAAQETDPLVSKGNEALELAVAAKLTLLAGGIFMLGPVVHTLVVFTKGKIAQDPGGFSEAVVSYCQMMFWIGWAAASGTLMPVIDGMGRKVPCYVLLAVGTLAGAVSVRASQAWLYGAMLFVVGFTVPPAGQIAYLLTMESIPERLRAGTTVVLNVGFSVVLILIALGCERVTRTWNWRLETLAWYLPLLLLCLVGPLFVSESPAFRRQSASASSSAEGEQSALRVVFGAGHRANTLLTCVCWTAGSVSYYGLSYSAGSLSPDLYFNVVLFALMDIVGYAIPAPMVAALGSQRTQAIGFAGTSLALLACAAAPQGSWAMVGCALVGRLCVDVAFSTLFLLIVECFPSECRAAALGVANVASRLLTFAAPLCAEAPAYLSCGLLGLLCAAALVATWLLDVPASSPRSCEVEAGKAG